MNLTMDVIGLDELKRKFYFLSQVVDDPRLGAAEIIKNAVDQTIVREARRNVWDLFNTSGDFPSRIKTVKISATEVQIEVQAPYAAVHEYGGTFRITERQRRFFWARWYETRDPMWKALALSVTYTIPARPYLRPAIDSQKQRAVSLAATNLAIRFERAVKNR